MSAGIAFNALRLLVWHHKKHMNHK